MSYHKWSLVVMRAQPFHNWHANLLNGALMTTPNVLVILGSLSPYRTSKNPFLMDERRDMIRATYPHVSNRRLVICGAYDRPESDSDWREQVDYLFESITGQERGLLVANCKPGEDYLPRIFHDWEQAVTNHNYGLSGTDIRRLYFEGGDVARFVPRPVLAWLNSFCAGPNWKEALEAYIEGKHGAA